MKKLRDTTPLTEAEIVLLAEFRQRLRADGMPLLKDIAQKIPANVGIVGEWGLIVEGKCALVPDILDIFRASQACGGHPGWLAFGESPCGSDLCAILAGLPPEYREKVLDIARIAAEVACGITRGAEKAVGGERVEGALASQLRVDAHEQTAKPSGQPAKPLRGRPASSDGAQSGGEP